MQAVQIDLETSAGVVADVTLKDTLPAGNQHAAQLNTGSRHQLLCRAVPSLGNFLPALLTQCSAWRS